MNPLGVKRLGKGSARIDSHKAQIPSFEYVVKLSYDSDAYGLSEHHAKASKLDVLASCGMNFSEGSGFSRRRVEKW